MVVVVVSCSDSDFEETVYLTACLAFMKLVIEKSGKSFPDWLVCLVQLSK